MIVMKPLWYETRAASRAISNFLALTEKVKRANRKRKRKASRVSSLTMNWRLKVWDVVWWETDKNESFLFTQTFQKLKKIKATKLSTLFQNHHSFLVSKIDACCLRFSFDGSVSQTILFGWGQLFVAGKWMCLSRFARGCSAFGALPQS